MGNVFINEYDAFQDPDKAFQNLSVCPQEDRLWDNLTGREHVKIYSLIRGDQEENINSVIETFGLTEHMNKQVKNYSLGTKRKLSVALAFIGNPQVILLDVLL